MLIPSRTRAVGLGFVAALILAACPLGAQEPNTAKPAPTPDAPSAKRVYDPARRVPDYFGQIGLTAEQREAIYKIRSKHQAKTDELEKQIAEIQAQTLTECEAVLTDTQKQMLEHRRKAASQGKKAAAPEKLSKGQLKSAS